MEKFGSGINILDLIPSLQIKGLRSREPQTASRQDEKKANSKTGSKAAKMTGSKQSGRKPVCVRKNTAGETGRKKKRKKER
jgi:hypothetical protein